MEDQVWVGPDSSCPAGWSGFESIKALLSSRMSPRRIVLDDRAAAFREADFSRLYEHAPLAKIERMIGPWRAGIGRTDPGWPLATTLRDDNITQVSSLDELHWHPLTSGYDELASENCVPDLAGMAFDVRLVDPELRGMWVDWLTHSGAELSDGWVDVLIQDTARDTTDHGQRAATAGTAAHCIISLMPDPWNAAQPAGFTGRATEPATAPSVVFAASILDSPAHVLQRVLAIRQRAAL